jgi:hypothetical protein
VSRTGTASTSRGKSPSDIKKYFEKFAEQCYALARCTAIHNSKAGVNPQLENRGFAEEVNKSNFHPWRAASFKILILICKFMVRGTTYCNPATSTRTDYKFTVV